jgi:phosphoglycerate kinase
MSTTPNLPTIKDIDFSGERVLLRVDFNVPLDEEQNITDDTRIRAALPTIQHLLDQGASLVICSHLGRPKGTIVPQLSLEIVARHLQTLLERDILFVPDTIGKQAKTAAEALQPGEVLLVENLRFDPREKKDHGDFGTALAKLGTAYVNDAFGVLHRKHASVHTVALRHTKRAVGFLIEKEYNALVKLLTEDVSPLVAVLGGAKVSDKLVLLENLSKHCSDLCIGGAMAYTFLKAKGLNVGKSRVESDKIGLAKEILKVCETHNVNVHLPVDHITAGEFSEQAEPLLCTEIPEDQMGLDIGPQTQKAFFDIIQTAGAIFWNGPMGVFEWDAFASGTKSVGEALVKSSGYSVVGGGDSAAASKEFGYDDDISHLSTGGGASLALLEGDPLPGLIAFTQK